MIMITFHIIVHLIAEVQHCQKPLLYLLGADKMIRWELRIHLSVKHVPYGGPADSLLGLAPAHHPLVRMCVQHLTDSTFK